MENGVISERGLVKVILFNEVKRLSETSEDAFTYFYNIMSRKDSKGKDILYICSTAKMADEVFAEIAKDYLDGEIHRNKRYLKTTDGIVIWVHPIMMLPPWLPGRKFKNIIFER